MVHLLAKFSLIVLVAFWSHPGFSHEDHDHGPIVSKDQARELGVQSLERLVKDNKIEKSYQFANLESMTSTSLGKTKLWRLHFSNSSAVDLSKINLYIYLDEYGKFQSVRYQPY